MSGVAAIFHGAGGSLVHAVWPITFIAGLVVATLIARYGLHHRWHARIERKRLMTAAEVRFWHVLIRAFPDHGVFAQVSASARLRPAAGLSRSDWWSTYGRFSQMIVDFVVVDARSGVVLAIVELDDRSHSAARDAARDAMFARGGYNVVRCHSGDGVDIVRQRFDALTGRGAASASSWRPRVVS